MTAEQSPRPWRIESDNLTLRPPVCFVVDANGAKVSGGFFSHADAAFIVAAVNERDRLRDLVRRLLMLRRGDIAVPMEMEKQILREARAAIGEDKP